MENFNRNGCLERAIATIRDLNKSYGCKKIEDNVKEALGEEIGKTAINYLKRSGQLVLVKKQYLFGKPGDYNSYELRI